MYRLLCLDAGFTLLTPRRTLADALSGVLAEDGRTVTEDEMHAAWEEADRWFWDEYHRPGNDTWSADERIDEYWRAYHGVMLGKLGVTPGREVLDRILASQFSPDAWEPFPDAEPMLAAVREIEGVGIGVVSDWGSNLRGILSSLGLDRYLDFILPSGAVGVASPTPTSIAWPSTTPGWNPPKRSWWATRTAPTSEGRGAPAWTRCGSIATRA